MVGECEGRVDGESDGAWVCGACVGKSVGVLDGI